MLFFNMKQSSSNRTVQFWNAHAATRAVENGICSTIFVETIFLVLNLITLLSNSTLFPSRKSAPSYFMNYYIIKTHLLICNKYTNIAFSIYSHLYGFGHSNFDIAEVVVFDKVYASSAFCLIHAFIPLQT